MLFWKYTNNPEAKTTAKTPEAAKPKLKTVMVAPATTPRSLKALSVQLKAG
jgi:hypothetical protein